MVPNFLEAVRQIKADLAGHLSADAIVSWMVLAMLLNCVIGIENCRLYWMNACRSPIAIDPRVTRIPPTTATAT